MNAMRVVLDSPVQVSDDGRAIVVPTDCEQWDLGQRGCHSPRVLSRTHLPQTASGSLFFYTAATTAKIPQHENVEVDLKKLGEPGALGDFVRQSALNIFEEVQAAPDSHDTHAAPAATPRVLSSPADRIALSMLSAEKQRVLSSPADRITLSMLSAEKQRVLSSPADRITLSMLSAEKHDTHAAPAATLCPLLSIVTSV
jgi:hypothetical protein